MTTWLALIIVAVIGAKSPITLRVSASVVAAPATIRVSIGIIRVPENRRLALACEGPGFSSYSEWPLDGAESSAQFTRTFPDVGSGDYLCRAALERTTGLSTASVRFMVR